MGDRFSVGSCNDLRHGEEEAAFPAKTSGVFQKWLDTSGTSRTEFARLLCDRARGRGWARDELDSCQTWLSRADQADPIPRHIVDTVLEQVTAASREVAELSRRLAQLNQVGAELVAATSHECVHTGLSIAGVIPTQRSQGVPPPPERIFPATAPALTPREREILNLLGTGHSNRQISRRLGVAERTVKNHLSSLFVKLEATDRTTAVLSALRHGLITVTSEGSRDVP
jgi:DNA-binding NarL/FixJ family response regulator